MARPYLDGTVRNAMELLRRLTAAEVDIKRLWQLMFRKTDGNNQFVTPVSTSGAASYHGTLNGDLASGGSQTLNIADGGTETVYLYLGGSVTSGTKVHAVLDVDGKYYVIAAACPE